MPPTRNAPRAVSLAALVVLSVLAGSAVFAGSASAAASNLGIVSNQPADGSGTVTVSVTASTDATVYFKVRDSSGTVSSTASVTDGTSADKDPSDGVVRATLDLGSMFESGPASGTAHVYASTNSGFSIDKQTYDTKRQLTIDADAPGVTVLDGATAKQGTQARIDYTMTDVPQKVSSATLKIVGPDGTVHKTVTGLQTGTSRTAQVTIPDSVPAGTYDLTLTAIDEAGHRTTDTLTDGLTVKRASGRVRALRIISHQPVSGTEAVTVKVSADGMVSFKVQDASGAISGTKTVSDGGSADLAESAGTVRTALDLGELYGSTPTSGTAVVYASGGDGFSIPEQTFDTKRQVAIDADGPSATLVEGGTAAQGTNVKVYYTVEDVPQKVRSITIKTIGPDGLVYTSVSNLQAGKTVSAEFTIPSYMPAGAYDVKLVAVDEVGHRASDRLQDGVTVKQRDTTDNGETSNGVTASEISIVSTEPVKGSGDVIVRTSVSDVGVDASFKVEDSSGTISATKTVTDGGSADLADRRAAVIETRLDLGALYEGTPASGTAVVYANGGDSINVEQQAFNTKRQVTLDSDPPHVDLYDTQVTAEPGDQVKLTYSAGDAPPKLRSVTMKIIGPDGNVYKTFSGLQAGDGRAVQFVVPSDAPAGEYDVKLVAVDEVGHRTTTTFSGGLVVA